MTELAGEGERATHRMPAAIFGTSLMCWLASLLSVSFASAVVAAPGAKDRKDSLYFPTAVGAKRVMHPTEKGRDDWTETVTAPEGKGGVSTMTVARELGERMYTDVWEVSDRGLTRSMSTRGRTLTGPQKELRLGTRNRGAWFSKTSRSGPGKGLASEITFTMGKEEEIEAPTGKFKAIRQDRTAIINGRGPGSKFTSWYAPGVGEVNRVRHFDGVEIVTVLKGFTRASPHHDQVDHEQRRD
jgi:hypothetical protein